VIQVTTIDMKTFLRPNPAAAIFGVLAVATSVFGAPPQSVTIVTPPNGSQILVSPSSPVTVTANATASAGSATITSIDFRVNGVSVGTAAGGSSSVSASVQWQPVAIGTYTLTAIASDSSSATGNTLQSNTVTVNVTSVTAPATSVRQAAVTAPAANATIAQNSQIFLRGTAYMSDGLIASIRFYLDSDANPLGAAITTAPFTQAVTLNATAGASVGAHTIFARATASDGTTVFDSAPVAINIVAPLGNQDSPTVQIISPTTSDTLVASTNIIITATATDTDGSITGVAFYADGEQVGATDTTAPYSVTWTPGAAKQYVLTAQAADNNSNLRLSTNRTVSVIGSAPTVTITAPVAGASLASGVSTNITANATAGSGLSVASVQFSVNGAPIGTDSSPPYSVSWTPTTPGLQILAATATDTAGGITLSSPVNVTVVTPSGNLSANLTVSGASSIPAGSSRVVTVSTTPATGIDRVELLLNDNIIGTDTVTPFSFVFTAPQLLGLHRLNARVVDSTGFSAISPNVAITVTGATGVPPVVGISAPSANAFLAPATATTISGTAVDSDGAITGVQVFANDTLIGNAAIASGTWSIAWTTPATPGVASITAIATDNSGNSIAAPAVGVNIADAASPAITLGISPVVAGQPASTTFPSGATKNFVANVTPASGRAVVRVEFFVDGTKVGEDTAAPYTFRYAAPPLAPEELSRVIVFGARATDNAGAARDVQVSLLVVSPIGQPPTVSLLTPTNNASVSPNTAVSLAATAVGNGGTIASVQFYVNGSPAPVNSGNAITAAPYTSTFTPTAPGIYTIDAIATDDRGNTTISNSARITAAFTTPTVAITTPNPNATARATPNVPLNLAATATVQAGTGASILLVEFLLDGVQIGADTTAPYTFSWTPNVSQLGQHVLTARVTDTNSQTATSAPVNVTVANIIGTPPTVTISTQPIPAQGLQTLSQVNFIANAAVSATGVTISNVEFFLNDVSIGTATREQATNLYRLSFDFSRFDFSTAPSITDPNTGVTRYTPIPLYAIARDSNNNQTVSPVQNLTVFPSTSSPPSIQLVALSPLTITQGQQFFIGPIFNDTDGTVTQLQLYANGTLATALGNPQQGQVLTYNANTAGRFNLYVVATDDSGNTVVSSPSIVVTVNAVQAPTTTITRPSDDSTATTVGAPVFLEGTASSPDTTQVPTLQFIATASGGARTTINGVRVGTTNVYRQIWTPTTPGTYALSTQANIGATATGTSSISRQVVVTNLQGLAATVTLNVPATTTTASTVNLTANANDSDGSVVSVEFFLNRNSIGQAVRDQLANTWRLTASLAGIPPGTAEVVALARDSSGNVSASPTSNVTVTAASSIAPSVVITPSTTNAAFNRQVQLRANARDTDGNVNSVQYFANNTNLGTSTNAGTSYQVNWTPTTSGVFNIWAVATDNTSNTTVASTVQVTVRRNNPILEDAAFILQTYQDIANTTNVNPLVFDDLDVQLGAGTLSRADLVVSLIDEPGFLPPVNLLAAYHVLMGQWPTPANYNALIATARGSLPNAVGNIISSNEYFAKYGVIPTVALLNNPASAIPADTFITRLWQGAGLGSPTALQNTQFRSNNVLTATLGRGYGPIGLNQAIAEFITNTNSNNTALFNRARAAALYYQLSRPSVTVTVDQITARVAELAALNDPKAIADAVLKDQLYSYRFVTITRHPQSLTVAPRSGVLFSVEAQGAPPLTYQWLLNGAPIANATSAQLSLTNVDATRVGTYTVVVNSSANTATSDPATLTLTTTPTRLANISTRGVTSGGANVLIGGFIVSGANQQQTRQVLIRVMGPTLANAPFNVTGVLANPRLEVYSGNNPNPVLTNDNWGTQAGGAAQVTAIQQAMNRAAAFAFAGPNSADAAVLATLPPGPYTVQAKGPANNPEASGVVLIEVYDVTANAAAPGRAANVSTRGNVGTGTNILIAGFVVNGAATRRVLIRGAGPTLASFGVPGVLADPQLTLIEQSSGRTLKTNNDWATGDDAPVIAQAATAAGAFPFANGSRDAAMIVMLAPGAYTVQLSGVNNGIGVGIVEVYDVDP
jgi:hypothetical protein